LLSIKLETEEEIAAWIAERKKNWPTAKNVELKVSTC
jgi:ribosome assembly protein 1